MIGLQLIEETNSRDSLIKKNLQTPQNKQKRYTDNCMRDLKLIVGDQVFLKVSPFKGIMRFGKEGKLSPHFIGLFEILAKMGIFAY